MNILFVVFEAWWRRWFGGGYIGGKKAEYKWYNRRISQHIVNCLIMALYFGIYCKMNVWTTIYSVAVIEGLFWAPGHGPGFDMSRAGAPDDPSRYEEKWWNKVCQFLVPCEQWYSFGYDWLWMMLRYTSPCVLLIPVFGWEILFMGLLVAPVYGFCASFYEKVDTSRWPSWLDRANKLAEIIVGAVVGLFWGVLA